MTLTDLDVTSTEQWIDGIPHEQFAALASRGSGVPASGDRRAHARVVLVPHPPRGRPDGEPRYRDVLVGPRRGPARCDAVARGARVVPHDHRHSTHRNTRGCGGWSTVASPRGAIATFEEQYRSAVRRVLAEAMRTPSFDFVSEVATPLPAFAISELLGVPEPDRAADHRRGRTRSRAAPTPSSTTVPTHP